ncbi:MAG: phosphoribosyl-AMP cyclohydrolase [Acidimicrobiales bacterium]
MRAAAPIEVSSDELDQVKFDRDGLVPAIIQEAGTGKVLMHAWMNRDSLAETLESGRTVFWSRSRAERWRKGDTSGERQWVREAMYDCDGDTLLFVVEQEGQGACHTGNHSCFYRSFGQNSGAGATGTGGTSAPSASDPSASGASDSE